MVAVGSSETSITLYHIVRRHVAEGRALRTGMKEYLWILLSMDILPYEN
jgi:hypothetical protein